MGGHKHLKEMRELMKEREQQRNWHSEASWGTDLEGVGTWERKQDRKSSLHRPSRMSELSERKMLVRFRV